MDINEAIKILKTEWQCLEFQITGVAQCLDEGCNHCKYKPVSFGKQIECHEKAIECLEAWNKIKKQIEEEKSYAHADYNGYKNDILKFDPYYIDGDYPLPKDYFGHGMERAEDIINKHLSEDNMWDKVVKEIKDNKPSSIDIELNGIERVGFAVGLNKAIEIIEKYKKEIEE